MISSNHPNNKLVSVIIPAYNAAGFIGDAIKSVINQTYNNWELIIIDDGSTDNTKYLVSEFLSDNRITYYKINNGGVSNARNKGAEMAKGDYLCFLDADDFFYEENLLEKVKLLNNNLEVALVHADVALTNEEGQPTGEINEGLSGNNLHLDLLQWQRCVVPAPSSIMIRKSVFNLIGKWDTCFSTAADQDLFIRVANKYKIERVQKVLTAYRIVNSSMGKNIKVFEKDHLAVYSKAKANKLFPNKSFENECYAKLHLIIAASWWNQEHNVLKTIHHLFSSLRFAPSVLLKKFQKKG